MGISQVVQWIRICLPMQGTWVLSLVWEDSTYLRATKLVTQLLSLWSGAQELQLRSLRALDPVLCSKRSHCSEKPVHHKERVAPA